MWCHVWGCSGIIPQVGKGVILPNRAASSTTHACSLWCYFYPSYLWSITTKILLTKMYLINLILPCIYGILTVSYVTKPRMLLKYPFWGKKKEKILKKKINTSNQWWCKALSRLLVSWITVLTSDATVFCFHVHVLGCSYWPKLIAEAFFQTRLERFRFSVFLKLPKHVQITVEMSKLRVEKGGRNPPAL